jgi:DNA-binding NtrC family response regulator
MDAAAGAAGFGGGAGQGSIAVRGNCETLFCTTIDPPMKQADTPTPRVLVADDQPDVLEALRLLLKGEGYKLEMADSPAAALSAIEKRDFDLALIDLNYQRDTTSGQEGLELLSRIQSADSTLPVVVMTAWGSVEVAVEAMRRGARDFIQKPWDNTRLVTVLRTQVELGRALRKGQRLEEENRMLRDETNGGAGRPTFIAQSPAMQPVLRLIESIAPSDANVLVTGENGTGKEVVAHTLHALSERASKPMITVNVGALSEGTFESELFGHVKGAYTDAKSDRVGRFELADGGTLFLDEIANIPVTHQAKLLRVVETGEFERVGSSKTRRVDVRMLSATNADLREDVAAGKFRQDLLFRLNTVEIRLPPLRERREDILPLALHFLGAHARRYRKSAAGFDEGAARSLTAHAWPGNVRELNHTVERAVLMARGAEITPADLGLNAESGSQRGLEEMSLDEVECYLIKKTLARFDGNVGQAAEALGLSRSALYRRLQRYGL